MILFRVFPLKLLAFSGRLSARILTTNLIAPSTRGGARPRLSFTICSRLDILPEEMGRKLRGISGQEAVKAFEKFGYRQRKRKGSHVNLVKPGSSHLTIPLHTELSVGLLANEIKKAGLTVEEFLELLGR